MSVLTTSSNVGCIAQILAELNNNTVCLSLDDATRICEALREAMPFLVAKAAKYVLEQASEAQSTPGPYDSYSYKFGMVEEVDRVRKDMERLIADKKGGRK